jgi:Holliday junction DNA helicase RuvB
MLRGVEDKAICREFNISLSSLRNLKNDKDFKSEYLTKLNELKTKMYHQMLSLHNKAHQEIETILKRSGKILNINLEAEAANEIAKRSRSTPRTANYLLKRCRDLAQIKKENLDLKNVCEALDMLEIDSLGLTKMDRDVLKVLIEKFKGGPVGLNTLATALHEEESTVEEFHEPYLIQLGMIERTSRGRIATEKAYAHLNFEK